MYIHVCKSRQCNMAHYALMHSIFIPGETTAKHPLSQSSKFLHWIHTFSSIASMMSSSYNPKQRAHSLEEISGDCSPLSLALSCFLLFLVLLYPTCFCWSSSFLSLSASFSSALRFFCSSLSLAFFFLSTSLFSRFNLLLFPLLSIHFSLLSSQLLLFSLLSLLFL